MALVGVRVWPIGPQQSAERDGLAREVWRLTGDGSDVDIVLTPDTLKRGIVFVDANGATHNLAVPAGSGLPVAPSATVTLTFATAPGNTLTLDVTLHGYL